jgi:hypothetical protein
MPAEIVGPPLALRTKFPNGGATHNFGGLPLSHLVRELLEGVVVLCSPNGTVKSRWSVFTMTANLRSAIRSLDSQGFTGGIADLRAEHLLAVCAKQDVEMILRPALGAYDESHPGRLDISVRRFLDGPWLSGPRRSEPVPPYSKNEEGRLREACQAWIVAVEQRVAEARAEAATGGAYTSATAGSRAHLLWTLDQEGPLSLEQVGGRLGRSMYYYHSMQDPPRPNTAARALWPTAVDLVAYRTLLGLETGIVPEGVVNLRVRDFQRVSGREVIIGWEKQRGGGRESDRFGGAGEWSPGKIFERAVEITAGPRKFAARDDKAFLWLAVDPGRCRMYRVGRATEAVAKWLESTGLDTSEAPFQLDGRRLRKTFYRRLDERFGGAIPSVAGINQSERVAAEHYLSATQPTEFLEAVVEAAYADALRRVADAPRPTVLTADEVERLRGDEARAAAELGVAPSEAKPLLTGERDVFACSCKDFYHSPYGEAGAACPAPVWTCLFCSLAVITPAKLPTLLRLCDHIDAQRGQMPADEWTTIYGATWHQLHANILPRYPEAVIEAARVKADAAPLYLPPHETHPGPLR